MRNITVHQIWLNEEAPPDRALGFMATWEVFKSVVHGPDEIPSITNQAAVKEVYRRYRRRRDVYRALSDLLRYQIMFDQGGLYVDIDMELRDPKWNPPTDPALFRPMNDPRKFTNNWDNIVCNGLLWFPEPGHPLMERCLHEIDLGLHHVRPHVLTGPVKLRRMWREYRDVQRVDHPEVAFFYNRQPESKIVSWSRWWRRTP